MEVRKIGHLSAEEQDQLIAAGKILKSVKEDLANKVVDELSPEASALVNALNEVIEKIILPQA